ncbi:MAG: flagellar biosynthesis anti-sigma factor FlgM [Chromatiaceae bacterium]|nr:flagellar biosynthesis anti-sigma factor FlgM [Gammaproteobacteria bacterium]MCP5427290.1 flagellar biosynthesis anti-sigma factor FlgM [Chromatiaceae bacterium]MCB1862217.1 flagellar biosynthesis anti-sigma factor FlgM [Gammaproteobacteria bacterium]MCB1871034.1 flagellar biosynthesis anti-sigma factor FlgM [Gammaproteobacteria bacterium]MCB1879966.1 flagellar biosynthesis anti-sigma factor FlgM [Gammaproteobacteria bacterium]
MSVEINGLPRGQIQGSGENRQVTSAKSAARNTAQPAKPANDDKVSLTSSATHLQELASQIAQLPVADPAIVAEIQRTVATGSFQIQPAVAADNLLTQEKELATLEVHT